MPIPTCVLDLGQFSSKIGFGGADYPSHVFMTMVGKPKYQNVESSYGNREQELYVGEEIQSFGLYKIFNPIQKGIISDWTYFEKIIDYIFYNLRVDPTLVNVLFSVHPLFNKDDLKRLFELFLEHYQCMAFYPVLDSMMTLYSGGFRTGLVIEIGDSCTRIVPIYQGFKFTHAIQIIDIGGKTLTKYMENVLGSIGYASDTSVSRHLVRELKEKACFVSLDYKEDLKRAEQYSKAFTMPDGSKLTLTRERFMVPEVLFNPEMINSEEKSLSVAIMDCIEAVDIDIRPKLLNNIFLSGGSSMIQNLKSRIYLELELELARRKKTNQTIKLIAPRERTYSVWIGGSILATIPEFSKNWITRRRYYEDGVPDNFL